MGGSCETPAIYCTRISKKKKKWKKKKNMITFADQGKSMILSIDINI
jgi:hypothetical protein